MNALSLLQSGTALEGVNRLLADAVGGGVVESAGTLPAEPLVVAVLTTSVVGMSIRSVFDSILSEDEDDAEDTLDDGDGGLMPEEGGDDLDDLGGGFGGGGEEFGDFEDDEFGDMDGGADTDELEHRLDELETEVGSLSSTVNTVRNENEQISETVDDVEENVRKLLDIYEMVTRGVNPFADDIDAGGGFGGPGEDSFGLFDDGDDQSEEGDLDEDIANADAEGFFDDDLVEDDDDLEADGDVGDVLGTDEEGEGAGDAFDDEFDDEFGDSQDDFEMDDGDGFDDDFEMDDDGDTDGEDDGGEGGKSFAELKDEYESGDADWAEGEDGEGTDALTAESDDADEDEELIEESDDDGGDFEMDVDGVEESDESGDALADDELFDTVIEDDESDASADEAAEETDAEEATDAGEETVTTEEPAVEAETDTVEDTAEEQEAVTETADADATTAGTEATEATDAETVDKGEADDGKPYLTDLPEGFVADLIVVEWLEFLVEDVGVRATAEAIDYYERIDWIDEDVADQLEAYLKGFEESGESASLTIDHHTRSLRYVSQLDGGGAESIALQQLPRQTGGGPDGIQR